MLFCSFFDRSNFNKGLNSVEISSFSVRIFLETLFSFSIFSFLFHIWEFSFKEQFDKMVEDKVIRHYPQARVSFLTNETPLEVDTEDEDNDLF